MLIIAGVIVFFVLRKRGVNDRPGIVPLNDRSGIVYSNGGKWVAVGRGAGGASGNSSILYYNDGEKWRSAQWTMVVVWVVEIKA